MKSLEIQSIIEKKIDPLTIEHTIQDALTLMCEQHISSVVIVDEKNIAIGIFTEHDSLKIVSKHIDTSIAISNVMSRNLFSVKSDMNINDAYLEMNRLNYRHCIIVDENGLYLGIVSQGDFLRNSTFKQINIFKSISDIALELPVTAGTSASIKDVAHVMEINGSDFVVIVDLDKPTALVTQRDISNFITQNPPESLETTTIDKLVTQQFYFLEESSSIREAIILMENGGVHQLLIVNDDHELLGIISRQGLLDALYGSYFKYLIDTLEAKNIALQELKASKLALDEQTGFLNNIINTIPHLIWIKGLDGKYIECNNLVEQLYGVSAKEIVGKTDYDLVDKELADFFQEEDEKTKQSAQVTQSEHYLHFADGREGLYKAERTPLWSQEKDLIGVLGVAYDITQQRERENELEKLANYDSLTNLPNRALLRYHLNKLLQKSTREGTKIAVVIFGLDRFKDINDSYGHTIGDRLLVAVSKRFLSTLRKKDVIARVSGDEFALVLDDITHMQGAAQMAVKMLEAISMPYMINGLELHVEASAGITIAPDNATTVETLIQYADSALNKAKKEMRGGYAYYEDNMTFNITEHLKYENKLRNAIKNNELIVYYQPQVDLQTNKIIGAEALARWESPEGMVMPSVFIPIAEETGLIAKIGQWMLNQTCLDGKKWLDAGYDITLAVNVSPHQLKYQNIPSIVDEAIEMSGFLYDHLELELTESAILNREEETIEMLKLLKTKGIRIALDDFGTGYSSLSYIKKLPIDVMKIDKSFIDDIPHTPDGNAIVEAVIKMGQVLGFKILAEGTEHIEQIEFLREKGCHIYQGYYKSKPVPAAEFEKLLQLS